MIEIKNLNLISNKQNILNNIQLTLDDGEIIGIIGPSGSGKSMLLDVLSGKIDGYSGTIINNGKALKKYSKNDLIQNVSHLNTGPPENPDDTVINFSLLSRIAFKSIFRPFTEYDKQVAEDCLGAFNLTSQKEKKLGELSGSDMKLLQLAHVFIRESGLVLLDNPTSDLEISGTARLRKIAQKYVFNGDRIILISSHDLNFIFQTCDRIIIMKEGSVSARLTPDKISSEIIQEHFGIEVMVSRNIYNGRPEIHLFPED